MYLSSCFCTQKGFVLFCLVFLKKILTLEAWLNDHLADELKNALKRVKCPQCKVKADSLLNNVVFISVPFLAIVLCCIYKYWKHKELQIKGKSLTDVPLVYKHFSDHVLIKPWTPGGSHFQQWHWQRQSFFSHKLLFPF